MKVLLIHPGIYDHTLRNDFPPWGALQVATYLRNAHGHQAEVIDACSAPIREVVAEAVERLRPDVVGFTGKLGNAASRMSAGVEIIRRLLPSARVVVGGPLTSTFPDIEAPLWRGVDTLIEGDGETGIASWIEQGRPAGVFRAEALTEIDPYGLATWWGDLSRYVRPREHWPGFRGAGIYVSAGRGCTRRCTFCYLNSHFPRLGFRYTDSEVLFSSLDRLSAELGVTGFYFVDDCVLDRRGIRLEEIAELNSRPGRRFDFGGDVQIGDLADEKTLEDLWKAGFRALYVGVESATAEVRKRLGKGRITVPLDDVIERALDRGFYLRASIGIGWPGESEPEIVETIRFVARHPRLAFDAFSYTPLANTPLAARREAYTADQVASPYEDYSEFARNWSELPDDRFRQLWVTFNQIRFEREQQFFGR